MRRLAPAGWRSVTLTPDTGEMVVSSECELSLKGGNGCESAWVLTPCPFCVVVVVWLEVDRARRVGRRVRDIDTTASTAGYYPPGLPCAEAEEGGKHRCHLKSVHDEMC